MGELYQWISLIGDPVSWIKGMSLVARSGERVSWTKLGLEGRHLWRFPAREPGERER